jgi:hypothetical protein
MVKPENLGDVMRVKFLAAIAVLAMAGSAQAANLVVNGSFTDNSLTAPQLAALGAHLPDPRVGIEIDSHAPQAAYIDAVTGWHAADSANHQDYNLYFFDGATAKLGDADSRYPGEQQRPNANFTGSSPDGGAFMVLDGDPGFSGQFQQLVTGLTAGQTYNLSFWWAAGELSNRTGYSTEQLTGTIGGDAFATPVFVNSHPCFNNCQAGDFSGWRKLNFKFTANAGSELLSFLSVGTAPQSNLPPVGFLDGVSVGIPEPAVWGMMVLGFGGMGAMVRRRRRLAA